MQSPSSAGPDCLDYDEEIQRVNMAKTSLMAKKAELERKGRTAAAFDRRMEDIANELAQTAGTITEFDEVTVRQQPVCLPGRIVPHAPEIACDDRIVATAHQLPALPPTISRTASSIRRPPASSRNTGSSAGHGRYSG